MYGLTLDHLVRATVVRSGFLVVQERLIGPGAAASGEVAQALIQMAMADGSAERRLLLPAENYETNTNGRSFRGRAVRDRPNTRT